MLAYSKLATRAACQRGIPLQRLCVVDVGFLGVTSYHEFRLKPSVCFLPEHKPLPDDLLPLTYAGHAPRSQSSPVQSHSANPCAAGNGCHPAAVGNRNAGVCFLPSQKTLCSQGCLLRGEKLWQRKAVLRHEYNTMMIPPRTPVI